MSHDHAFHSKIWDAPPMYPSAPIAHPTQPQVMVVQSQQPQFGPHPQQVTCPSCHYTDVSEIKHENTMKTHLIATILCVTTCCCCIPYMIDSCKSTNHICKSCGAYLGTYDK